MVSRRVVALLSTSLLWASLAHGVAAEPLVPKGKLVFSANRGASFDLWVASADGSTTFPLTETPDVDELDPAWSPDGQRVAFAAKPAWRPGSDIWVMDADGSGLRRLTKDVSPDDRTPAWSPDGTRLAWVRSVPGQRTSELWTMNADGTGAAPLVRPEPRRFAGSPDWSPDGQRIAFVANLDGGFPDLWTVHVKGSGLQQVTSTAVMEGNPVWSPDGSRIAFEQRWMAGTSRIWSVEPTGEGLQSLTSGAEVGEQPAWAPDGASVAYVRSPLGGGPKDVEVASLDGGGIVPVTATERAEVGPDWAEGTVTAPPRPVPASPDSGPSGGGLATTGKAVGPGLKLIRGRFRGSDYWALRFDPDKASTLDVALATDVLPGRERVSSMAKRHGAIAAINGDFPTPSGAPIHHFAEDGELQKTGFHVSHNLGPSMDEETMYLDRPDASISLTEVDGGDTWAVDRWNDRAPTFAEAAGYSPVGGGYGAPPSFACSVRLVDPSPASMPSSSAGFVREYTVDAVACRAERLHRAGGVVLAARPGTVGASMIASLTVGEAVALEWSFHGWTGVADSLGGWPPLLHEGKLRVERCSESICFRHPRAGVGVTGVGRVLLVVVDGRRKRSKGVTLLQFAKLFRRLGAISALNLDGGGTAEMWLRGKVLNHPSDGHERPTASAILVLPGGDPGHAGLIPGRASPAPPGSKAAAARASLLDPASTGGFLDGIASGLFGTARSVPPELRDELREFRARHP